MMNRESFEEYLHKRVTIELEDGEIIQGYLHKTGEKKFESDPNLFIPINYYFLTETESSKVSCSCLFRMSHVIMIKR